MKATESQVTDGAPVKFEVRSVKTMFTREEREAFVGELLRARREAHSAEMDFEGVKAHFKAKLAAIDTRIEQTATCLENGWEMRNRKCRVVYDPANSKKYFFAAEQVELADVPEAALLVEPMLPEDFQQDLLQAESQFELREELPLFAPAGESHGILVVGRLRDRWYTALRVTIAGRASIEERLDSEQRAFKQRADAISITASRALSWLSDAAGKEAAKGFEASIQAMVEGQKERVE